MTRINQKEYEILKGLDDRWKWIARDRDDNYYASLFCFEDKPYKSMKFGVWGPTVVQYRYLGQHDSKFQFIQWGDEEPYSVAELIEEYEFENVLSDKERFYELYNINESEEPEVNKYIERLKNEINELPIIFIGFSILKQREEFGINKDDVMELIDQFEELERPIELQELIEKYSKDSMSTYDVKVEREKFVNDLQNLLVPKQKHFLDTLEDGAYIVKDGRIERGNIATEYTEVEPEVLSQELPSIPQFVAEWYESEGNRSSWWNWFYKWGRDESRTELETKTIRWMQDFNEEKFVDIFKRGYKVEEEQKYYLKIGNLYLAEPLGDMTSDIVRMTRDKEVAYQFTDKESIATHLDKFEGIEAVKAEEL